MTIGNVWEVVVVGGGLGENSSIQYKAEKEIKKLKSQNSIWEMTG